MLLKKTFLAATFLGFASSFVYAAANPVPASYASAAEYLRKNPPKVNPIPDSYASAAEYLRKNPPKVDNNTAPSSATDTPTNSKTDSGDSKANAGHTLGNSKAIKVTAYVPSVANFQFENQGEEEINFGDLDGMASQTQTLITNVKSNVGLKVSVNKENMKNETQSDSYSEEEKTLQYALNLEVPGNEVKWDEIDENVERILSVPAGNFNMKFNAISQRFDVKAPGNYVGKIVVTLAAS